MGISDTQNGNYGGELSGLLENDFIFGPQFALGTIDYFQYPVGIGFGNFDLSYNSILPDGNIDTTNGFAVADVFYGNYDFDTGITENIFISFQSEASPNPRRSCRQHRRR